MFHICIKYFDRWRLFTTQERQCRWSRRIKKIFCVLFFFLSFLKISNFVLKSKRILLFLSVYLKRLVLFGKICIFALQSSSYRDFLYLNVLIKRNRFKCLKRMSMFIHQSVEILNMPKESYAASLRLKAKATDAH